MSLADLMRKGNLRAFATATPATFAAHAPESGRTVATAAKVAVAIPPHSTANDPAADLAGWNVTLQDGIQAETVAKFRTASRALDRQIAAAGGPPADRDCWPHSSAMNGQDIETFTARLARFTGKGLSLEHGEREADRLVQRDRDADDRRLCLECQNLRGRLGNWRCANWHEAGIAIRAMDAQLPDSLVSALQRCNGFSGVTP